MADRCATSWAGVTPCKLVHLKFAAHPNAMREAPFWGSLGKKRKIRLKNQSGQGRLSAGWYFKSRALRAKDGKDTRAKHNTAMKPWKYIDTHELGSPPLSPKLGGKEQGFRICIREPRHQ